MKHEDIWRALDTLAAENGLSASGLAKRSGLDATTFNPSKRRMPDGRARWPSTESLAKVLNATGASLEAFTTLVTGARALTAAAVARIVPHLPRAPATWIVAGGGARNPTLMRMLAERLAPARVETAHTAGWSVDSLEAQAFAYLAVRSLRGLPITFPGTTGAPRPLTGGVLVKP